MLGAKKFLKENKAQGALEYLLIIGGAILLAAIVIAVVINVSQQSKGDVNKKLSDYKDVTDINSTDLNNLGQI